MLYMDGQKVHAGDLVTFANVPGRIVFVIDSDEYIPEYPREDWDYLKTGVGIVTNFGEMFVLPEPDEVVCLVESSKAKA